MRALVLTACAGLLAVPAVALAADDPLRSQQYGLDIVESDAAHATATGRGATIAIIDTGVQRSHPDLQGGRLLQGRDFVDGDDEPQDDVDGHGTHVLGIAGATENNGEGVSSVAPGATLLPVRVLDNEGGGFTGDVAAGIDYAVEQGAHVINLSLGGEIPLAGSDPVYDAAIDRALDAGRVVVAASGNSAAPACGQPSSEGRLLCVGSVNQQRQRSEFSNFAGSLGITAPGGSSGLLFRGPDIVSTFIRDEPDDGILGPYASLAGTSQATPHVAGVAALLVEKGLRGRDVVQRILATASDAGIAGPDEEYGAGIVNARAAVAGLAGPTQEAAVGTAQGGSARISLRARVRIRTVLRRRGVRVRCTASGAGRCRVTTSRNGRRLAEGSARLTGAGVSVLTLARLNRQGRTVLRRALSRRRPVRLRVRVSMPGTPAFVRRVTLLAR